MNKPTAVKPITLDDVELLRSVALQSYNEHYLHLWHDKGEWYIEQSFSVQQLSLELQDSNARFFLVYDDAIPVGFIKVNINAPINEVHNALELERIYFIKQAVGKGLGSLAVNYVFDIAKSLKKEIVWLKVMDSSHAAMFFYQKMGFKTCGTYVLPYERLQEELRGMYIMQKQL